MRPWLFIFPKTKMLNFCMKYYVLHLKYEDKAIWVWFEFGFFFFNFGL